MKKEMSSILVAVISMIVWFFVTKSYSGNFSAKEAEAIFIYFGLIVFSAINGIVFLIIWRKEI